MAPARVHFESTDATVTLDPRGERASVSATVRFTMLEAGEPAFDLRQPIGTATLDGQHLPPDALAHQDVSAGWDHRMRVVDRTFEAGSAHTLLLTYDLGVPDCPQPLPIQYGAGTVFWDWWMSDLYPGRYLEQWLPANLCFDQAPVTVRIDLVSGAAPHEVVTNGHVSSSRSGTSFAVAFPATTTSLSPMLVLVPAADLVVHRRELASPSVVLETAGSLSRVGADEVEACHALAAGHLAANEAEYGPWAHGRRMTLWIWEHSRGMEYDGAAGTCRPALEHEVFHSWFGRGIKPLSQNDGWIDEAWTTWCTAEERHPIDRFSVQELGLDEDPVMLSPPNPWARSTPVDSYGKGARLFAGIAHLFGSDRALRDSMGAFYREHRGGLISTAMLEAHLAAAHPAVSALFARYVYGGGGA